MSRDSEAMFRAVRRACSPAVWSRGIELARAGAVDVGDATDDEAVFHVSTRGGMICPTVSLYPDDLEWDCDCEGRESVCEHVAAAVIVWHRAGSEGGAPRPPRPVGGRIGYRFRRVAGGLGLDRVVVVGETEQRLDATIVAVSERRVEGPRVMARQEDLAVELALGTHRHGLLPPQLVSKVLVRLADCDDVRLDGRPVKVDAEPLLPVVRVRDRDAGFVLELVPGAPLTERFANGIVLCENTLRVPGDPRLTAREREDLERGWHFPADDAAELVTAVLPSLKRRLPLEIETQRLPGTVDARPRAVLDVAGSGETLSVLPTLVYGDPPLARIDGGRLLHLQGPVPMRDPARERTELRRLARLGLAVGVRSEFTGVEAVTFTRRLETWDGEIRGRARDRFRLAAPLEPEVATDAGAFDVTFRSVVELPRGEGGTTRAARTADPEAVLRAWQAGETLVPLLGGGWAPLPADWLDRYGARLADLLAARDEAGAIPRCCLPDLARLCEELDRPPPVDLGALRTLAEGFERIPATSPPADLVTELRPYQREGIDWLALVRDAGLGAMLADDMGLGKTLQALCVLRPRTLVVSPTSVLHNWAAEIRTHRPGLSFCLFHGSDRELDPNADVTLTTYALLRLDADRLASERWETVVLDEAQYIKNPESQVAQAAFRLDARFRLTLTGTPVENRLDELWSQFHFINRGLLGGRRHFQETYVSPILAGDEQAADRLRRRIRPFILRRLKKDVARDLPPRTEMLLRCELSEPEREIYDTVRAATLSEVVRQLEGGGGVMAALEALLRLRQAACHGSLVPECTVERSAKLELLLEALDTVVADGHKALVFSQWTSLLDLAEPHVRAASLGYVRLDGTTRDRAEVVRRFQEDPDVSLMLISLKAGGTGLNLTAADHIFLLDPWWNPAVEDQAADRAHRIGQDRPVMVYRLVALDTVEERILELQRHKRDLADLALEGTGRATGLTRDDLLHLLG